MRGGGGFVPRLLNHKVRKRGLSNAKGRRIPCLYMASGKMEMLCAKHLLLRVAGYGAFAPQNPFCSTFWMFDPCTGRADSQREFLAVKSCKAPGDTSLEEVLTAETNPMSEGASSAQSQITPPGVVGVSTPILSLKEKAGR